MPRRSGWSYTKARFGGLRVWGPRTGPFNTRTHRGIFRAGYLTTVLDGIKSWNVRGKE